MKNKVFLSLIEQVIMLLVFALAAAICVQIFLLSNQLSWNEYDQNQSMIKTINAAETLKSCNGNYEMLVQLLGATSNETHLELYYDDNWNSTAHERSEYQLQIYPLTSDNDLLGTAKLLTKNKSGDVLFTMTVAWQEVS